MAGELRAPLITLDPLAEGTASIRVAARHQRAARRRHVRRFVRASSASIRWPKDLRTFASFVSVEASARATAISGSRCFVIESLQPVAAGGNSEHRALPRHPRILGQPSLAWPSPFHKRPRFSTLVHMAQSGVSVRNAQMQYPIWEFEFTYEFITDDRSPAIARCSR
jgi:hypothetical protein